MSKENAEVVRRAVDAFNRADLDGFLETWAPDGVWDWSNSRGFDARVYRGHDEIRAFAQQFLEAWDEVRVVPLDHPLEREDGRLVLDNVTHMRGRGGIETQARSAWLITIRDGKQAALMLYQTKREALAAAALPDR